MEGTVPAEHQLRLWISQPAYVRAFRFAKNDHMAVEMMVKGFPSSPQWCGANSVVGAPGFQILKDVPTSYPLPKHPTPYHIKKEYMRGENVALL